MKKLFLIPALALIFTACNNNNSSTTDNPAVTEQMEDHDAEATSDDEAPLALNNGQKWEVNEEMRPHVENGKEMVAQYIGDGATDYKRLAESLTDEDSKLVQSCTMTGASHEELHKWLHPHLDLVKELKNAPDENAANEIIQKLQASYETFGQFFN